MKNVNLRSKVDLGYFPVVPGSEFLRVSYSQHCSSLIPNERLCSEAFVGDCQTYNFLQFQQSDPNYCPQRTFKFFLLETHSQKAIFIFCFCKDKTDNYDIRSDEIVTAVFLLVACFTVACDVFRGKVIGDVLKNRRDYAGTAQNKRR